MSDLFSSLTSAARALEAQRYGLDVTGQNIANVNTPGYARRVADLSAVPPDVPRSAGRGVEVSGVRAMRDRLLERRLQQELPAERREAAIADALAVVETTLGPPGASLDARLGEFFDAFGQLAEDPASAVARQEVVIQGRSVSAAFADMADRFAVSRREADATVRDAVEGINGLTVRIAANNDAIAASAGSPTALHLQDEQLTLVRELAELVDIDVVERQDGGVDVSFGNGRALVIGERPYSVSAVSAGPDGMAALSANGFTVTTEITGGRLGGLLHVRDVSLPAYMGRLDEIAHALATRVNAAHTAGVTGAGGTGQPFFAFDPPVGGPAGAAAALTVDPDVAADPGLVAAGAGAGAGDNTTARVIADLRAARVLDGNNATLVDGWSQLTYRVGRDTQAARDEQQSRVEIVRQVDALRDQVSGISLDEEAMQLLKYQRAYEANARFFRAVDQALDTLLQTLAR
jgi:flagellar hook-associated protein 1 FlgK